MSTNVSKATLKEVYNTIKPYVHTTPVLTSNLVNKWVGAQLFFKCENFQRAGSFKIRGATNAILNLSQKAQQKGVVTHSSGNFAQALSLAAKSIGVPAYIVMPENAPSVKIEAVKQYGGQVTLCKPTLTDREQTAQEIVHKTGATFIHPSNDTNVILGQSTAALELLTAVKSLDIIIAPVGGGGLLAGTALAAHFFEPNSIILGAEPENVNDAYLSLKKGKIVANKNTNTIADGLKTQLGPNNFPIIKQYVSSIICVSEDEIIAAMRFIYERMKIVIEPSSAVALAAIKKQSKHFANKSIGVIISGGNVDLSKLPFA